MRVRHATALFLAMMLAAAPFMPAIARAEGDSTDPESRVGVALAILCGASLRATLAAPVPWAGVAFMSCLGALIDAATSPDDAPPPSSKP